MDSNTAEVEDRQRFVRALNEQIEYYTKTNPTQPTKLKITRRRRNQLIAYCKAIQSCAFVTSPDKYKGLNIVIQPEVEIS